MLWLNIKYSDGTSETKSIIEGALPACDFEPSKLVTRISVSTEPENQLANAFNQHLNREPEK